MQHAEHGEVVLERQPPQQAHDLFGGFWIEARDRLVGEQDARALRQRPSDRDALRLAARQRAGALRGRAARAPTLRNRLVRHGGSSFGAAGRRARSTASAAARARRSRHWPARCAGGPDWRAGRSSPAPAARARSAWPLRRARSWPPTSTSPSVGSPSRAMQRSSVVLPLPLLPRTITSSPALTVRSTPSSASLPFG